MEEELRRLWEKAGGSQIGSLEEFVTDLRADNEMQTWAWNQFGGESVGSFNEWKTDFGFATNNGATRTIKFAPEQEALLRVISKVESGNRPNVIVGGKTFDDFSKHPKKVRVVTEYGSSDAAGPYQFLSSTYEPIAEELGLDSFDVDNQSIAALHLAEKDYSRRTGGDDIYKAIKRGDYEKVRKGLAGEGKNTTWQAFQNYDNFESDFVRFLKEERAGKGTPVSRPTTPTPTVQKKTSEQLMDELTGSVAKNQAAQTDQQTAINRLTGTENDYSQEPDLDVAINNSKKVMANQRQGKSSFTDGNRRIVTKDSAIDWSQGVVTDPAGKKVQIVTETNFPVGSLSPGGVGVPGPDLTTEITDEQKQAQAKLIEKNVDQAALNKLEEANAALGNVNFDNINKYKGVEATLPIDVDFDNQELRNKKAIVYPNKKENTDSESFNSARADLARFTAANSAILESSDHFLKKEFGNNWSKDVSNIYNQVNPIVETLNNLGAQIEKELGSTVPEVKGHKELVNNYLSNKQSLDGLINSYNGVQEKLAAINANVNTLTADYEAGKISQADYESGYTNLSQQFEQISAETNPLEEQIKIEEQTLAEIKAQEKAVLADYNSKVADKDKHPLVKQYKQAVDKYESLMDKVEPYENNPYFKKYSKAYNDLTDTKDVYANVFKDRIQKEAETKRLQELSDFYVKSLPKDPTLVDDFNRIRTDLSFAVKNIFSDDLAVGPLSVGVNKLKGFTGKFVGDLAALAISTPLSISDKTKSLADVVNYGDFLSLETLQQDTKLANLSTRTDWQGGFKENGFEIKSKLDQELVENLGLKEGDNLIVDGGKVVAVRDKEGFKRDISTWDSNTYNYVNKYVKDSNRKTESDISVTRGLEQSAGSVLDFVALVWGAGKFNTALKAGATKFGVKASERLTSTAATTGVAFGQMYGNNLKEYLDKGLDPSKAVAAAITKTGVSAMVETVIGPMEARLVAGGASRTVLANFRKVRDTTMDLVVRGKIGTQDALRLIGKATGMGLRDTGTEYAEEVVQNTTDKVSDFLFSGEKVESMTFNEHVNTMFTVGLIQILPAIKSGRAAYNTGKVDLITTALYQFSQDPSAITKLREDIKNGDSNITESQLAEIEQITPYIKDEIDLYDVDKNRKVAITGLITDRYYKEQKLKNTTNSKAKEKLQESIDTINTEIEGVVNGSKEITIDPTAADFVEEDSSVAVPVTEIEEAEIVTEETNNDAVSDTVNTTTETLAEQTPTEMVAAETETPKLDITRNRTGYEGDFLNDAELIGDGSESTVYRKGDKVVKVSEPYNDASTYQPRVDDALLINELVGDGSLQVVGYYESPNGTKNPVYEQNYVEGQAVTEQEAREHLVNNKGFTEVDGRLITEKDGKYYEVTDLTDNFIKNAAGDIVGIDAGIVEVTDKAVIDQYKKAITQTTTEITPPTEAQRLDDLKNNRFATFTYDNESQVPEIFRDRISSRGEVNGKPFVKVTLPQSVADYELAKQSLGYTQTTEQGVSTTETENVENAAPASTNTAALPTTLTDVTLTNKAGTTTTGTFSYNEEKQTWSKVNPNGKKTPVNSQAQKDQLNTLREQQTTTNNAQTNEKETSNTQEGEVDTTLGQEGQVVETQNDGKTTQLPSVSAEQPITEVEVETLLEEIGKDSKAREEQIYKFFALPAALGDKTKAREIARITNTLWENVAKQLSKRSGKTADAWIKSRVAMLGKTSVADAKARGNAMFQVIGEQGAAALDQAQEATTRLDNLVAAREMEVAGKTPSEIRLATGWEKSIDNKWQYETNTDLDLKEFIVPNKPSATIPLRAVVNFEELQKAYPEVFENTNIVFTTLNDAAYMAALSKDGTHTIYINKNEVFDNGQISDKPKFVRSIAHELQHIVSNIEGFQRGSNLRNAETRVQQDIDRLKGTTEGREIERLYNDDKTRGGLIADYYLRSAGEVQARNVEERFNLTPAERQSRLLQETEDVAREDQIVLQDGIEGLANSIAAGNVSFQSNNTDSYTTAEAATAVANNLITGLDRMIAERSDKDAIKARGWTMAQAATDLKNLRAVKANLQKNMKDPKWQVENIDKSYIENNFDYIIDKLNIKRKPC